MSALGIIPAKLALSQTPHGPGLGVVAIDVVLTIFVAIGLTITAYAVRKVPAHLELGDRLTVK